MAVQVISVEKQSRRWTSNRDYNKKPRLYLGHDEANDGRSSPLSPLEQMVGERWQSGDTWAYRARFIPEALKQVGLEGVSFKFSQKAGCSCPCSPGWVLGTDGPFDIYVTIGDPEAIEAVKPFREASRYLQAKRYSRAILTNANQAFSEGEPFVKLKDVQTWYNADLVKPGSWRQQVYS